MKMKKNFLIYQIIFSFFILSFSSCINQDFDLDDEKLDTNVTLGSSINLPVGDIQKISVYEELQKVYDQLKVGDDNVLYIEYDGTFPVEFPDFEVPEIQKAETKTSIPLSGDVPLSSLLEVPLLEDKIKDVITKPELEDNDFEFDPIEIGFKSLTLKIGFELSGISLAPVSNTAEVVVTLTIPGNYSIDGQANTIKKTVPFVDIKPGYNHLGEIKVNSYTFVEDNEDLVYKIVLEKGNAVSLTAANPIFTFVLEAENPKPEISYLQCSLSGTKEFTGKETGFGDLQGAFDSDDTLKFRNPSLVLDLATNLGVNFKLDIDLLRNAGSGDEISASLDDNNLLSFEKSADGSIKTQSYELTPENLVNFDNIISTPLPRELDYTVKLKLDDSNARLVSPGQWELSADYLFKIPFNFREINLSLKDTITNLFNEDTYEQVFSHTKENVSIEADLVDVSIGNGGIKLSISAVILDSKFKEIINLGSALKEDNTLSIAIKGDDLKKMKNARHLEFIFRLSGEGAIKKDDYIKINGVRLVSGSGIHYEF
jgi:hypothetical protein